MKFKRRKWMTFVLSFIMVISSGIHVMADAGDTETTTPQVEYNQTEARRMLDMVNTFRTGAECWYWNEDDTTKTTYTAGELQALVYDENLEQIAMQRAAELAISFSHTRPNGEMFSTLTYNGTETMGENIASGLATAEEAFAAWQEANEQYAGQGHRRNMLSDSFTTVGIACAYINGSYYWVQEFGIGNIPANGTGEVEPPVNETEETEPPTVEPPVNEPSPDTPDILDIPDTPDTSDTSDIPDTPEIPDTISLENAEITLPEKTYEYKGTAVTPEPTVTLDENVLEKDIDYTVSYQNNEKPGTAKIMITGIGKYSGSIVETFEISCVHKYDDGKVTTPATCAKEGEKTYTCEVCGETKTETLEKTEHTIVTDKAVEATCTEEGKTEGSHCSECGEVIKKQEATPALGHKWDEGIVTKQATYTSEGEKKFTCTVCKEVKTEAIPKLEYRIVEGVNGSWRKGSDFGFTVKADGAFEKFVSVEVDGNVVDPKNYEAKAGSTIITLKPEYLSSLKKGKHTIRVNYTDGHAETTFTIKKAAAKAEEKKAPKTGDELPILPILLVMLLAGGCVLVIWKRKIKK